MNVEKKASFNNVKLFEILKKLSVYLHEIINNKRENT